MHFLIIVFLLPLCSSIDDSTECFVPDTCSSTSLFSPAIYGDERFIRSRNCFCDSLCEQYGDCCYNNPVSTNYECIDYHSPLSVNNTLLFYPLSVWMRTRCLPSYIGSSADFQCRNLGNYSANKNPTLFVPVTSRQTNITYRNFYCAYCNNDANFDIEFWEYKPWCHGDGSDNDYIVLENEQHFDYIIYNLTQNCRKTILYPHVRGNEKPSVFIRPCKKALPSTCPPQTSADLALQCFSSPTAYRYVMNSTLIYRNPYCARCNEMNHSAITCFDPISRSAISPLSQNRIRPLSILFDPILLKRYLNSDSDHDNQSLTQTVFSLKYNCSIPNHLYDLFTGQCSIVSSSDRETIISMKCQNPFKTLIIPGYGITYSNGTIFLVNGSITLTRDEYVFIGEHQIVFCGDRLIITESTTSNILLFPLYRTTINIVCVSISLACFVVFAIIFWLVSSLHNLPGKCLLLLALLLFIGQVIFISTADRTENGPLCLASAVIVHYVYLASFFWLVVIAVDIHSTFTSQTIQRDKISEQRYRLLAYNVIVWCSSGIIVLVACIIQFTQPQSSFSPAYGRIFCSISNPNAMALFFLGPIGCLLLTVTILYVRTLSAIYRSRKMAKLATTSPLSVNNNNSNNNNSSLVFVYIRLASLMGLQWILLIIALLVGQTWAWIIFEIVNSLPGLFICFGFLCSRRLFNTIKQKITSKFITRRHIMRSSTMTNTTLVSPSLSSSSQHTKLGKKTFF